MKDEQIEELKNIAKGLSIKGLRERVYELSDIISDLVDEKNIYDKEIETRLNKIPPAISIKNPGCYYMAIKFNQQTGKTTAIYCGYKKRNINLKECEDCDQRRDNANT